ncbi:MAG TPA: hypothetical protein VFK13_15275 [Gemmatimonadaceae bacterium]|nr:hypothetical protein [Gemmatimonadaceae bacterium]
MRTSHRWMSLAVCLCTLAAGACMRWTERDLPVADLMKTQHFEMVRVTRTDSSVVMVRAPEVDGSTLVGERSGATAQPERVQLPLDQIARVEVMRVSGPRSKGLIVGVAAVALGLGLLVRGITEAEH